MIAIVNVGHPTDTDPEGVRNYEVRINGGVICRFRHRRADGLAVCLRKAMMAVDLLDGVEWREFPGGGET